MKLRLAALSMLALVAGAASAQPPSPGAGGPRPAHGPGGFGLLQFDANADGKLTKAEFETALRARFNKIDTNKDGSANREEFEAARRTEMEARRAEISKERFAELDTDKNGQLSQTEFSAAGPGPRRPGEDAGPRPEKAGMRGGPPPFMNERGPRGPRPDQHADADADAKVTFAEFSKGPTEAFTRADANKDGAVTIAELQALPGGRR